LLAGAVTVVAALGAIAASWDAWPANISSWPARPPLLRASSLPPSFLRFWAGASQPAVGPAIRIVIGGLASILAFVGLHRLYLDE